MSRADADKQTVVVAVYEHKYGTDVRVFREQAAAYAWRTEIAEEWWDHEFPTEERPGLDEIGESYFELMSTSYWGDAEYFTTHDATVEGD